MSQVIEITKKRVFRPKRKIPGSAQISPEERMIFWRYCKQTEGAAQDRSRTKGVPCTIDAYYVDQLMVDQGYRCAVSGIRFKTPRGYRNGYQKDPFGPSIDRIDPARGYVQGNLRLVCNIVNQAMSEWGLDALLTLVKAIQEARG